MVESIIERINSGRFWDFHGGIHPPEQKTLTSDKPIKQLNLPKQLIIPLQQHIGREGELLVKVGEQVLKGQALTLSTNPMVVPIHAPTSGVISAIKQSVIAHPSGLSQLCVFLDVDGQDTWRKRNVCSDIKQLSNHEIIEKIADAGISGMGGAGFPTHIKANSKPDINFLIINGVECEPYITSDDLIMTEQSDAIIEGIHILDRLLKPAFILIAIEDNKPRAIKAIQKAVDGVEKIKVCVIPTKYPAGGEKQLIQVLTGQEIPSGSLPIHSGIVMHNVATCFAINDAVRHDIPLIRRVVTVTGQALEKPQNVWALLGTPIKFLLEQCGAKPMVNEQKQPVIMGGPMMGFCVSSDLVPIIKTSNCILVPSKKEMPSAFDTQSKETECIRCGQCSDVCPSNLLPQELQWSAKAKDYEQLEKLNLSDCIDCGACAYVCPSQIPLVHYYRIAKAEIRQQQQLDLKAEKAKQRFEARKLRLEKEKRARQEKNKKAAAARKAAMNKKTPEANEAKSAVAAALARVKAKKAAGNLANAKPQVEKVADNVIDTGSDEKSQVAAAIARAKAKRQLKADSTQNSTVDNSEVNHASQSVETASHSATDDKKAKIAAAIAKAKAKKQHQHSESPGNETSPANTANITKKSQREETPTLNDKKAKIAAAVAKAKAKKAKQKQEHTHADNPVIEAKAKFTDTEVISSNDEPVMANEIKPVKTKSIAQANDKINDKVSAPRDKKAKIAAAIAKAKAKKKSKEAANSHKKSSDNPLTKQPDESI
ncbi:electron transport complex subunit RsxC [Colwelliaceae bacterium MEBiC 14330]